MHELSYVKLVYKQVRKHALSHQAKRVISVTLSVSALSGIESDSFVFYWNNLTKKSILANSKISFHPVPVNILCRSCQKACTVQENDDGLIRCRECGSINTVISEDTEVRIQSIKIET